MVTLISHFFNEEYLLPWWIQHHVKAVDHAILIDYSSTDQSVEIIRRLAPHWEVRPTRNRSFEAQAVDDEVADIESALQDWKIALNTTEFLVGNLGDLAGNDAVGLRIPGYTMIDPEPWNPPNRETPLVQQKPWGIDATAWQLHTRSSTARPRYPRLREARSRLERLIPRTPRTSSSDLDWFVSPAFRGRLIHRASNAGYGVGRHSWQLHTPHDSAELRILHYSMSPWTPDFEARKAQIRSRIPTSNRVGGKGAQHFVDVAVWDSCRNYWAPFAFHGRLAPKWQVLGES